MGTSHALGVSWTVRELVKVDAVLANELEVRRVRQWKELELFMNDIHFSMNKNSTAGRTILGVMRLIRRLLLVEIAPVDVSTEVRSGQQLHTSAKDEP